MVWGGGVFNLGVHSSQDRTATIFVRPKPKEGEFYGDSRPKPTALRILQGNPGKKALNKREPKPRVCIPPCPRHLTPRAKSHWKAVAPKLARIGLLTERLMRRRWGPIANG
jgi:hypothetical protein